MSPFRGLSAFPITPADAAGRIEVPALRRLLANIIDAGMDSIGLLGSTGTYPFYSRAERRRAIEVAVEEANGRLPILAGIGALRTDETIALAQDAKAAGAAAGLLAPVSYTPLLDDEVYEHFAAVAAACDLPLCIYNNPMTTHFTFSPALTGRLSALPQVQAVKNLAPEPAAIPAALADLRGRVPADFSLGYSVDMHCAEAVLAGADAWYSVVAGIFPQTTLRLQRAAAAGDATSARAQNAALAPLWDLSRRHTGLRMVYSAARILGLCDTAPPRPLLPLAPAAEKEIEAVIKALGLR